MIKKIGLSLLTVFIAASLYFLFNNSITQENSEKQLVAEQQDANPVYTPYIPKTLNFAGEEVPLSNFDVYESLDNEMLANTFWHSQMIRFIKRANRYFPVIEPILKANNIPEDFKYLAVAESGLANVVSPAKASGIWQFMKTTAKEFDLEVRKDVDERYHLEKATQAACDYLNVAYQKFGSWTLVAASYNMGMGGLERRIEEQKVSSYYDLHLNSETARYVYRIIAIKTIMEDPKQYGFKIRKEDMYRFIPSVKVSCDTTILDLKQYAIQNQANYKILKALNPWLRSNTLKNPENKVYEIRFPEKGFRNFANSKNISE